MILIDGKKTAADIRGEIAAEIASCVERGVRTPGLAVILVGEDPASQVYVRNKERACEQTGIRSIPHRLPASTSQEELLALIASLNNDPEVDGILLQLPLPKGLDADKCLLAIDPDKDVDGFHPVSVGRLVLGLPGFVSCTPAGVIELLRRYDLPTEGKNFCAATICQPREREPWWSADPTSWESPWPPCSCAPESSATPLSLCAIQGQPIWPKSAARRTLSLLP